VRTGSPITRRGRTDGAGEGLRGPNPDRTHILDGSRKRGPIPPCPTLLRTGPFAAVLRRVGRTGSLTSGTRSLDGAGVGRRGAQSRPNTYMDGPRERRGAHCACAKRTSPSTRRGGGKDLGATGDQSLPENSSPQRLQGVGRRLLTEVAAPFIKRGLPSSFFILPPNPSTSSKN